MERKRLMNGFPFSKALPRSRKICTEGPERNPGPQIVCRPGGREAISRGFGNLLCGDFHTVQQLGEDGRILLGEAHGKLGQPLVEQRAREQPHVVGQ